MHLHENVSFQGHNLFAYMFVFVFLRAMRTLNKYSIILNMRDQSLFNTKEKRTERKKGLRGAREKIDSTVCKSLVSNKVSVSHTQRENKLLN